MDRRPGPDRHVLAIDGRGHGRSDKPHRQELYGYRVMARDVLNFMDHFGIARADLMGYSLGSFSGVYLLGHHTDRFRSMVLGGIGDENDETIATARERGELPIGRLVHDENPLEPSAPGPPPPIRPSRAAKKLGSFIGHMKISG